ncbi:MAG: AEC family transporter, partial [Pseudomonadota bacterium]|nr:AEC family transporter [Pseudomonadota bacterium]
MYSSLTPLLLTLIAGVVWRRWSPGGIAAGELRNGINALITYLLAPALILDVMFTTPLDATLAVIPAVGALCAALTFGLTFILLRGARGWLVLTRPQLGALLLATAFGNGLGMALPTVRGILGEAASRVPMIYDVLLTI